MAARESARDACERGEVPRGRPGGAGGLPWSTWPQTHHGRGLPAAYGGRRAKTEQAERREMEVRAYLRFLKIQGPLGKLKISPT